MARPLGRLDQVLLARWFGEAIVLVIALAVIFGSALASTDDTVVRLFGYDIPVLCTWRRVFDMDCPGCGMTRAFVFMAHGRPMDSFEMNVLGPPLFALLLAQIPYRAARLVHQLRTDPSERVGSPG